MAITGYSYTHKNPAFVDGIAPLRAYCVEWASVAGRGVEGFGDYSISPKSYVTTTRNPTYYMWDKGTTGTDVNWYGLPFNYGRAVYQSAALVHITIGKFSEIENIADNWYSVGHNSTSFWGDTPRVIIPSAMSDYVYVKTITLYGDGDDGNYSATNPRPSFAGDIIIPITISNGTLYRDNTTYGTANNGEYCARFFSAFAPYKADTSTTYGYGVGSCNPAYQGLFLRGGTATTTTHYCTLFPSEAALRKELKKWGVPFTFDLPTYTNKEELPDYVPDGQPDNPTGGGTGTGDNESDTITFPSAADVFTPSAVGGYSLLAMTPAELAGLTTIMWSPRIDDISSAAKVYLNTQPLTECVCNISYYPFDFLAHDPFHTYHSDTWRIGWSEDNFSGDEIRAGYNRYFDMGSYQLDEYYGSFLDYSPYTSIDIWLPYIGYKPLDVDVVMSKKISVKYCVDFIDGLVTATIFAGANPVNTYTGQLAIPLPVTARDNAAKFRSVVDNIGAVVGGVNKSVSAVAQTAAGVAAGGGTGAGVSAADIVGGSIGPLGNIPANIVNAGMNLAQAAMQQPTTVHYGTAANENWLYLPQKCHLKITRTVSATPAQYKNIIGYPCAYTGTVAAFGKGFLKVQSSHGDMGGIPEAEAAEIDALLRGGVYIE